MIQSLNILGPFLGWAFLYLPLVLFNEGLFSSSVSKLEAKRTDLLMLVEKQIWYLSQKIAEAHGPDPSVIKTNFRRGIIESDKFSHVLAFQ